MSLQDPKTLPMEEVQGFPLSPQQRHLWRLLRHGLDAEAFRSWCLVRLEGNLDPVALSRALRQTAERHEILRTTFCRLEGMTVPLQVIAGDAGLELDCRSADAGEGATLAAHCERARRDRLDVERGPVWAAWLADLPRGERVLALVVHALCGDMASLENLVQEIAEAYGASLSGQDLTREVLQYADLAEWQNTLFEEGREQPERDFWLQQDFSALGVDLPVARPAGPAGRFEPERVALPIEPGLSARLTAWSASRGCQERLFLLTGWCVLLARWSGSPELVVGVAHDGRSYEELKAPLGLFARYLPLACRVDGKVRFQDQLDRVRSLDQELAHWQESFSWESLREGEPAFARFCFDFVEPAAKVRGGSVDFQILHRFSCVDRFAVKLVGESGPEGLTAEIHYDAGRFCRQDIARLGESLRALLDSVVSHPEPVVEELGILGDEEWQRLYGHFESAASGPGGGIHREFERQALRRPGEWAVVCGAERLSYAELNLRANRLARHLCALGVGLESRVAICLERSVAFVESMLAVLKAGGAFVPLDPSLPKGRLLQLLHDSGAEVLLTRPGVSEVPEEFSGRVVWMDDGGIALHRGEDLPEVEARLAYVMYTSGSTGTPKGVAVEHASLRHYLGGILRRLGDVEGTHWATVSTFAADLGNTSIFTALCGGGCLHVIPQDCVTDPGRLRRYLVEHPVDGLKIVPGHWSALQGSSETRDLLPRRWLVLGGEACGWDLVERVRRMASGCRVLNHYGPTETTVGVLTWEAGPAPGAPASATVPLGRPLPGSRVYVLDAGFQGVPSWVAGEVYIGGGGVARGYLNRPDLTAERFIPDPFGPEPGGRLYRTGDLARCLAGGELEFLGRVDDQVKIRGFRVELGEIESTLRERPGIEAAAVVVQEDAAGERRLVAYVVPSEGDQDPGVLRGWLAERLPSYMVPSAFVRLAALPRTANGKLNRAALPAPREAEGPSFVAPRTPVEEMVANVWSGLLGRDRVGAGDDFFALGGHSLLATQLLARLREAFGVEISLRSLFDEPTVAGLARCVEAAMRSGGPLPMPLLQPAPRDGDLPLSFAQQRLWFLDQMEPGNPYFNIPSPICLSGRLDEAAMARALTEIVRRHEVLRTTFPKAGGRPVQVIAPPGLVGVPVVDLGLLDHGERRQEAERLTRQEARRPFDLARGPLLRVTLLTLEPEEHLLLLTLHHIVSDAWSMPLFVQEAVTLYRAFVAGAASPLPELAVQYADFAYWQRRWLEGKVLEDHLRSWRRQLAGAPAVFELPPDRPRPAVQSSWGVRLPLRFSASLSRDLKALSRSEKVTLFMTLVAAFNVLLRHATGRNDIVLGTNIANRTSSATESMIGFFINQLVLRVATGGALTFRELLGRVRSVMLEAYAHQDLPFEKLVEELQPERHRSRSLLFQIKIEMQNRPALDLALPDLKVTPFDLAAEIVRYDLHLLLFDEGETISGVLQYDPDLFDHDRIVRISEQFEALLCAVAQQPEAGLDDLGALLAEKEKKELSRLEGRLEEVGAQKLKRVKRQAVADDGGGFS